MLGNSNFEHFPTIRFQQPDDIVQQPNRLYLTLNASLGDTFNALLHLTVSPPSVTYSLICKSDHASLISLLMPLFKPKPHELIFVPTQDGNFPLKIAQKNTLNTLQRGFQGSLSSAGHVILWSHPASYNNVVPLKPQHIERWVRHASSIQNSLNLPRQSVIFFTRRGIGPQFAPPFNILSEHLKRIGFVNQFSNVSQIAHYGDERIPDTEPLAITIDQVVSLAYSRPDLILIGLRSGIFDVVRFARCPCVMLYDKETLGLWSSMRIAHLPHLVPKLELLYEGTFASDQWETLFSEIIDFLPPIHR